MDEHRGGRTDPRVHGLIMIRFSTSVTPGADQAARSASRRSAHDRTLPVRITLLPWVVTWICSAFVSAVRTSASSIFLVELLGRRPDTRPDERIDHLLLHDLVHRDQQRQIAERHTRIVPRGPGGTAAQPVHPRVLGGQRFQHVRRAVRARPNPVPVAAPAGGTAAFRPVRLVDHTTAGRSAGSPARARPTAAFRRERTWPVDRLLLIAERHRRASTDHALDEHTGLAEAATGHPRETPAGTLVQARA